MGKASERFSWLLLTWLLCGIPAAGANPEGKKPVPEPPAEEAEATRDELTPGTAKSVDIPQSPSSADGRKTAKPAAVKYTYKKDNFLQVLKISHVGKDRISFTVNLTGRCELTYAGTAFNEQGDQGTEMDEDADGNMYSVDEYIHDGKGGCFLKLRLDSDGEEMVRLIGLACKRTCRLREDVVMRREK